MTHQAVLAGLGHQGQMSQGLCSLSTTWRKDMGMQHTGLNARLAVLPVVDCRLNEQASASIWFP